MHLRLLNLAALLLAIAPHGLVAAERNGKEAEQVAKPTNADPVIRNSSTSTSVPITSAIGRPSNALPRNPRVVFITQKDCEKCDEELARLRKPGGVFAYMTRIGWKIGESADSHIQIVDRTAVPELVQKLQVKEYPTVACISGDEIVRSFKHGCTTPLDGWTFGWLIKGRNERPGAPIPEEATVDHTGSYPLRGNHWSVDGDWTPTRETLLHHLRGPVHGPQLAANWKVESWSYEELRSVHDDLHEKEMGGVSYGNSTFQTQSMSGHGNSPGAATNKFFGGR